MNKYVAEAMRPTTVSRFLMQLRCRWHYIVIDSYVLVWLLFHIMMHIHQPFLMEGFNKKHDWSAYDGGDQHDSHPHGLIRYEVPFFQSRVALFTETKHHGNHRGNNGRRLQISLNEAEIGQPLHYDQ